MLALLFFAFALGRRRVKPGAALTVLLTLLGCEGGTPSPEQPAAPPGTSPGTVYYFHNDRLGTPVRLTNEEGVTVWRAEYRPFGDMQRLETDVDGDSVHIEQPLRFPGQYDDAMSALILAQGPYYNLNRYFEPGTGRFFSPEPLLKSAPYVTSMAQYGMSVPSYAYGANNPLYWVDPTGLLPDVPCPAGLDCGNLGNFEPPPEAGPPAPQRPYDPNALPPSRGGSGGTPAPMGPTPDERRCAEKCGVGAAATQRNADYCRRNRPNELGKCLRDVARGVQGCFDACMRGDTRRGAGELTCR